MIFQEERISDTMPSVRRMWGSDWSLAYSAALKIDFSAGRCEKSISSLVP
jgi:hypothetical protein